MVRRWRSIRWITRLDTGIQDFHDDIFIQTLHFYSIAYELKLFTTIAACSTLSIQGREEQSRIRQETVTCKEVKIVSL
jgi:hypothetical protein